MVVYIEENMSREGGCASLSCLSTKWSLMKRKLTELSEDCENIDAR